MSGDFIGERSGTVRVYISGNPELFRNYHRAVERAGGTVQFGGVPHICDALLLPGGGDLEAWRYGQENWDVRNPDPERDEAELSLLEQFVQKQKPVFGICRGLQVINVFFGGTLIQDLSGHSMVRGADRYHSVNTADKDLLHLCGGERILVNSAHHQAIDRIGEGLRAIQWAEDGTVEAVRHEMLPILAVQWHPERLGMPVGNRLFQYFLKSGFYRE